MTYRTENDNHGGRLSILDGRFERGSERIYFRPREHEVVAYLAFRKSPTSGAEVAEALWDGGEDALRALKVHVWRIRQRAGGNLIRSTPGGYALSEEARIDTSEFEQSVADLRRSVRNGAWRDCEPDALVEPVGRLKMVQRGGLAAKGWFCDWLCSMERRAVDTLLLAARASFCQARYDITLAASAAILAIDDCDEEACELAIRASLATGARSRATGLLMRYERRIDEELGLPPPLHLRRLLEPQEATG